MSGAYSWLCFACEKTKLVWLFWPLWEHDWALRKPIHAIRAQIGVRFLLLAACVTTTVLVSLEWGYTFQHRNSSSIWSFRWILSTALIGAIYSALEVIHLSCYMLFFPACLSGIFAVFDGFLLSLSVLGVYITVAFTTPMPENLDDGRHGSLVQVMGHDRTLMAGKKRHLYAKVLLGMEVSKLLILLLSGILNAIMYERRQRGLQLTDRDVPIFSVIMRNHLDSAVRLVKPARERERDLEDHVAEPLPMQTFDVSGKLDIAGKEAQEIHWTAGHSCEDGGEDCKKISLDSMAPEFTRQSVLNEAGVHDHDDCIRVAE